jgi:hypothetical protein
LMTEELIDFLVKSPEERMSQDYIEIVENRSSLPDPQN